MIMTSMFLGSTSRRMVRREQRVLCLSCPL